jgi:hypothetical protein
VTARTVDEISRDIAVERAGLADAVGRLRGEVASATDVDARLRPRLPVLLPGAFVAGFVLAGGVGASMRYLARRGRER